MKSILYSLLLALFVFTGISCKKSTPAEPPEANLMIALNPDPGTTVVPALGATYAFKLLINSTPPKNGVKIDITGTKESDNSTLFTQTSQTSSNTVNSVDLQLSSLVQGIQYIIKVDVTSLTTSTNKASITFRIARK